MKVPYGLTMYILLTIYLRRGLNKFPLECTQGERYYGDAECSSVLCGTEACPIVARDNSCLYLWQANRLIKGGHVCFCARYLALSKHCHISTPQPSQPQHFLPYCGGRPWHVEPAVHFFSPRELWPSCQWLSKNACLIEKFSRGSSWWNAEMQLACCWDAVNVVRAL